MEYTREFIQRLKRQDAEAFTVLYKQTCEGILRYIRYKVRGDAHLAEDILSEVYCRAIEYAGTLNNNVKGWLYRIAASHIADHYRKKKRDQKLIQVQQLAAGHKELFNRLTNPQEADLLGEEDQLILRIAFTRLDAAYRDILKKKYVEGASVKTIAAVLQKSEKAVENMLYRGRKFLEKEVRRVAGEKIYTFRERRNDDGK